MSLIFVITGAAVQMGHTYPDEDIRLINNRLELLLRWATHILIRIFISLIFVILELLFRWVTHILIRIFMSLIFMITGAAVQMSHTYPDKDSCLISIRDYWSCCSDVPHIS